LVIVIFAKNVDLAYGYLRRKDVVATPMWDERDIEGLPVCTVYLVGEYWRNPRWEGVWRALAGRTGLTTVVDTGEMR
jgi:hypothetical protein